MSNELDDVARSLFIGQIPSIWRKLAPDTLKSLGNWMVYFLRRFSQYTLWVSTRQRSVRWFKVEPGPPLTTSRPLLPPPVVPLLAVGCVLRGQKWSLTLQAYLCLSSFSFLFLRF